MSLFLHAHCGDQVIFKESFLKFELKNDFKIGTLLLKSEEEEFAEAPNFKKLFSIKGNREGVAHYFK